MKIFLHFIIAFCVLLCGVAVSQSHQKNSVFISSQEALAAKNKPDNYLYMGENFSVQNVYPNPADDFIKIKYSIPSHVTNIKFEIRNILGNVVSTHRLAPGNEEGILISTVNLDPGIYFHSLYLNNKNLVTKKLIIKR